MNCILCEEQILKEQDKMMVGLDIPYINIWFHRICYREISSFLNEFLQKNFEKWYNNYMEEVKNDEKSKKYRSISRKL
jgi:hypothetical protein